MKILIMVVLALSLCACKSLPELPAPIVKPQVESPSKAEFCLIKLAWYTDKNGKTVYQKLIVPERFKMLGDMQYPMFTIPFSEQVYCIIYVDPYIQMPIALLTIAMCDSQDMTQTAVLSIGTPSGSANYVYTLGPENAPIEVTAEELQKYLEQWQAKTWMPEDADYYQPMGLKT